MYVAPELTQEARLRLFAALVSKRMAGRIVNGVFMRCSFASLIVKNDIATVCPYGWCSGGGKD